MKNIFLSKTIFERISDEKNNDIFRNICSIKILQCFFITKEGNPDFFILISVYIHIRKPALSRSFCMVIFPETTCISERGVCYLSYWPVEGWEDMFTIVKVLIPWIKGEIIHSYDIFSLWNFLKIYFCMESENHKIRTTWGCILLFFYDFKWGKSAATIFEKGLHFSGIIRHNTPRKRKTIH